MTPWTYWTPGSYMIPLYGQFLAQRSLRIVTPTTGEQITLDQARQHLRLDLYGSPGSHPDDDLIEEVYIPAAREVCESISGRAMVPQTFELGLGAFPWCGVAWNRDGISLQIGPVAGVLSFTYIDGNAATQTIDPSGFILDPYTEPGYVYPIAGASWPSAQNIPNAVAIRFNAGYDLPGGSPQDRPLPAKYRAAMLLMLGHLYENREDTSTLKLDTIPNGVASLLLPSSLRNGFA